MLHISRVICEGPTVPKGNLSLASHLLTTKVLETSPKGKGVESLGLSFLEALWWHRVAAGRYRRRAPARELGTENPPPIPHSFRGKVFPRPRASYSRDGRRILWVPHTGNLSFHNRAEQLDVPKVKPSPKKVTQIRLATASLSTNLVTAQRLANPSAIALHRRMLDVGGKISIKFRSFSR